MTAKGWTPITIRTETAERINAFQILAIARTGRMLTKSEAINLALELAAKKLTEG